VVGPEGLGDRLAEAMAEEPRPASLSSSSRSSDVVKVESLGGSEVTSCDELEEAATATSSDIEVLSYRGHQRGGSDQSTGGEEVEALRQRNRELEEVVTAREGRLVAVSREVAGLQAELEDGRADRIVTGELRRRVALLEGEVAGGVRQAELQAKEVEKMKKALAAGAGDEQEKVEVLADLRSEGEALARQNGKQAEVIRKLRAKEKTTETDLAKYKAEAEKSKSEVERLSKSLTEKNGVEGSQSSAIKTLTEANQAWEAENRKVKNDLEDNVEKVAGLRKSLEAAYREMAEMKRKLEDAAGEAAAATLSREVRLTVRK
jgi:chromosome segregation ATPase